MKRNEYSRKNVSMPGWPLSGKLVYAQFGMIYWYSWGDSDEFDIRVVRSILGLPSESKFDFSIMNSKHYQCSNFHSIMSELESSLLLSGRDFNDVLAEHDSLHKAVYSALSSKLKSSSCDFPF